jgi:hypothetical protein
MLCNQVNLTCVEVIIKTNIMATDSKNACMGPILTMSEAPRKF